MINESNLNSWQICRTCRFVSFNRVRTGSQQADQDQPCETCQAPPGTKARYFESSLNAALNFIHHAYQSKQNLEVVDTFSEQAIENYPVSILVFFGVFQDLLLNRLLSELAQARGIPQIDDLLAEHKLHEQKQRLLFPRYADTDWSSALRQVQSEAKFDCLAFDARLKQLAVLRQRFIYLGYGWNLDHQQALNCINAVEPLINLHVLLHNHYVHPCHKKNRPEQYS